MKIKKLNSKGFSHIEIILFAVSLVVVSGIGYYVYQKNTTAHAGNLKYVYIGTASAPDKTKFKFSACKQAIAVASGVASGTTSGVTSGVVAANYAAFLSNFNKKNLSIGPYLIGSTDSSYWTNGVTTLSMPFSSKITNYTWGSIQSAYKGGPWGMTGFWFNPNGLSNC